MTIPDFQTLMLPTLRRLADRRQATGDLVAGLSDEFGLDAAERAARLPSGRQGTMANRVHWALAYLNKAGLITRAARAIYEASPQGREVLQAPPERITVGFLRSLTTNGAASGVAAVGVVPSDEESEPGINVEGASSDPLGRLAAVVAEIEASLADDLVAHLRQATPTFFERVVLDVLRAMGYGGPTDAGEASHLHLGRSGDGGIDGSIKEDALGLDMIHLQAKQYAERPVGVDKVREFAGALEDAGSRKGVLIALSTFTAEARAYAARQQNKRIVLIDGTRLVSLMIAHGVGVRTDRTIEIRRIDANYFEPGDAHETP